MILIAGAAGFIGINLSKRLQEMGYRVVGLDNFSSGIRRNGIMEIDIENPIRINGNFEYVINLACPASPPFYQADRIKTAKTCFIGTLNLLNFAKEKKAKLIQASTSEVYGDPEVEIQSESYNGNVNILGPRSCYDEGKRISETLCNDHPVESQIIRIFNTYGPHMRPDDGRLVTNFITQAITGNDVTVYGDGSQTRSLCYIDDLIDGIIRIIESDDDFIGPINIGSTDERRVIDIAKNIIEITGSNSAIKFCSLPKDDPRQRRPDITLANKHLGWEPKIELKQGLTYTIKYISDMIKEGK